MAAAKTTGSGDLLFHRWRIFEDLQVYEVGQKQKSNLKLKVKPETLAADHVKQALLFHVSVSTKK